MLVSIFSSSGIFGPSASNRHKDDFPLASLPLLGYTVNTPSEKDSIHKDFVFKLQFKNHVYFFRAESEYTFGRSWLDVVDLVGLSMVEMCDVVGASAAEMLDVVGLSMAEMCDVVGASAAEMFDVVGLSVGEISENKWMEVISSATLHSGRVRLFSRQESGLEMSS
uniref:PH domain-containing protein n=1 Tax=Timema genevievae TaxID=629358 RepID=A0A7R9PQC3_TIMGE|nr:unnamed protein product [Timema genevievae]